VIRSLALCAPLLLVLAPAPPEMPERQRVRLAEAFAVIADVQDEAWPGWSRAPSSLVLVDRDFEYLVHSDATPEAFVESEVDPRLGGRVLARPRTFSTSFLATFPAFGPTPTIVVGTAEATGKRSTRWVLAVAHEHFHQLQYSDPSYWHESQALGLAGGDQTGMWMLNYPFPYEATSTAFAALSRELARLVGGSGPAPADAREAFWRRYAELRGRLKPADDRYLSFQLWQEGIARYVETRVAELAGREHRVSAAFAALPDYQPFDAAAAGLRDETVQELRTRVMARDGRMVFYAFGAGLGLLLDQEAPGWRSRYLAEKFYLERYREPPPPADAVPVPGAVLRMGTDAEAVPALRSRYGVSFPESFENETPAHVVEVSPFRMDRDEVTNARFAGFLETRPEWRRESVPAERQNGHRQLWTDGRVPPSRSDHPVVFVTWHAAQAFCRWAGGRLPTEAEWELAARAGTDAEFPWGDAPPSPALANYAASGMGDTVAVGRYPPNPLGLHDLAGNVWELVLDEWQDRYPEGRQRDPVAGGPIPDDSFLGVTGRRVLRGGSFGGSPVNLRTRWRDSHPVTNAVAFVGFRCVYPSRATEDQPSPSSFTSSPRSTWASASSRARAGAISVRSLAAPTSSR
jgi:formylglycine-generating enzyme required for sulfatase activity